MVILRKEIFSVTKYSELQELVIFKDLKYLGNNLENPSMSVLISKITSLSRFE
jgi:hypothetical protein